MRTIGVIGAPSSAGAYAPGQERTPAALRDIGLLARPRRPRRRGARPRRHDALPLGARPRLAARAEHRRRGAAPSRPSPRRSPRRSTRARRRWCSAATARSASAPSARSRATPGYGLLYLDMHSDMNTPASTDRRRARLDGRRAPARPGRHRPRPRAGRAAAAGPGSRCSDSRSRRRRTWEREQLAGLQIATTSAAALIANPGQAAEQALAALPSDCARIAVHFDVDVIDFTDAPLSQNTGRNVGVPLASALAALDTLLGDPRVAAVTVTELNPLHGASDGSTLAEFSRGLAAAVTRWAGT